MYLQRGLHREQRGGPGGLADLPAGVVGGDLVVSVSHGGVERGQQGKRTVGLSLKGGGGRALPLGTQGDMRLQEAPGPAEC